MSGWGKKIKKFPLSEKNNVTRRWLFPLMECHSHCSSSIYSRQFFSHSPPHNTTRLRFYYSTSGQWKMCTFTLRNLPRIFFYFSLSWTYQFELGNIKYVGWNEILHEITWRTIWERKKNLNFKEGSKATKPTAASKIAENEFS